MEYSKKLITKYIVQLQLEEEKENKKKSIWNKGAEIENYDPNIWRFDKFGNPIKYSEYGNRQSKFGWEFDHDIPKALGGSDAIINLSPLKATTNASLGGILGKMIKK